MPVSRQGFVVLGAFRSGTSLISRIMTTLGVSAGPNEALFEPSDWNPRGYFQRPDVTQFNKLLMESTGGSVSFPKEPDTISTEVSGSVFGTFDLGWTEGLPKFLIKDPRLCVTLKAWLDHGLFESVEVKLVRIRRDLESTAKSCLLHYDVKEYCLNSIVHATEILSFYNRWADWHCLSLGLPVAEIDFDDLITRPEEVIKALASFLGQHDAATINAAIEESAKGRSLVKDDLFAS